MSSTPSEVPFVVGSDGSVNVNVLHGFTSTPTPEMLLERARSERGRLLVAVELDRHEIRALLGRLESGAVEAVTFTIGARARRGRRTR